jgi:WD40 repeat protein
MVVAALSIALLAGLGTARLSANRGASSARPLAAGPFGTYAGQQARGVFQTISRIVASGRTIVTTGAQVSDGVVRQQFFASADDGGTWHLAPVRAPGGGQLPLGYAATRLAVGPRGWLATGPGAIWTSRDGLSWTLVATHGITGGQVFVLTGTADGFLAAGQAQAPDGKTQAVIWTSRDGVRWQRMTAAQAGLGGNVLSISYATSRGQDTVISGPLADGASGAWLSTDGGQAWTPVTIPAGHGAANTITGLASSSAGLIAVRPGTVGHGVAYFSPNGRSWQYSATLGAAAGFTPQVVKGSTYGFVVTGTGSAGTYIAYTSTGDGTAWRPTGPLGTTASYSSTPAATVAPGGTVIVAGSTAASKTGQQAVLLRASSAGLVRPVPLAGLPGALLPEVAVKSLAIADGQQIAVGSADGYPAIWRKTGGFWTLVSSRTLVSAAPRLAALTSVTHGSAGWLAVGVPGPVAFTSADGTTWRPAPGSIARDLTGVADVAAAAGPRGYVIVGKLVAPGGSCVADVWWSPNMASWTRAHDVNDATGSSQVLAVAASAHGFISAGSHDGQPALWTTTSGPAWKTIVLPLPHGATGVLQQIAIDGNRVVALGVQTAEGVTRPLAELSTDGGATWRQVPFGALGPEPAVTALTASPGGFVAAVQTGAPGQPDGTVWTAADGANWTRSHVSGLSGSGTRQLTALASSGTTVTGIASIATPQIQRPVILTLSAR